MLGSISKSWWPQLKFSFYDNVESVVLLSGLFLFFFFIVRIDLNYFSISGEWPASLRLKIASIWDRFLHYILESL